MSAVESSSFKPLRMSSLLARQRPLAKNIITNDQGWVRVERFAEPEVEWRSAETGVVLSDISHLDKVVVKGKDTPSFLCRTLLQDHQTTPKEHFAYECSSSLAGDRYALCCVMAQDEALVLSESGSTMENALKTTNNGDCLHIVDMTSFFAGLYFLGPDSRSLVSKLTELDIRPKSFGNLSVQFAEAFHVQCILLRNDLNGILGFTLFFDRGFGEYLWDRIMYAGKEFNNLSLIGSTTLKNLGWRGG